MHIMRFFLLILLIVCNLYCSPNGTQHHIDRVSIIYDSGEILRIVGLKSNDLIRWRNDLDNHSLKDTLITNYDSLKLFDDFYKSIKADTNTIIKTVTIPTVIESDGLTLTYYDDTNDIPADAMIVYHYNNGDRNDSVFVGLSIDCRINNYKAICDTTMLHKIRSSIFKTQ